MSNASLTNVLHGIRTILLANGFSKVLLLAIEFMLAFFLGAEFFGLYAITQSFIVLISFLCLFGLNYGVVQFLSIYQEQKDPYKQSHAATQCLSFLFIVSALISTALYLVKDQIALNIFNKEALQPLMTLCVLIIPIETLNQGLGAIFRGLRQFTRYMLCVDLIRNVVLTICLPIALFTGDIDLIYVLSLYLFGGMIALLYGLFVLFKQKLLTSPFDFEKSVFKEMFGFTWMLFIFNLFQVLSLRIFILAAGIFLSAAETGILAVGGKLALFMIFFQTAVNSTLQAEFAKYKHHNDLVSQQHLYQNITRGLLCVCSVIGILFLVSTDYILHFIGEDYVGYGWILWPMILAHMFNVVTGPSGQVLISNEKQPALLKLTFLDMGLQFLLVIPMMHYFGIIGATLGETLRLFLFVSIRLLVTWKLLQIHPFTSSYLWISGLTTICIMLGIYADLMLGFTPLLAIIASLTCFTIGILTILKFNQEMQDQLRTILTFRKS